MKSVEDAARLERDRKVAASECITVMAMLSESKSPHALELATMVAARLVVVVDAATDFTPIEDAVLADWLALARELVGGRAN